MKILISKFVAFIFITFLAFVPYIATAQPPGGGCDPGICGPEPDCCVPIDGGLSLLIAAGIGLGAKKAYDRKKAGVKIGE